MINFKQILQKPKLKFWIIGTVVALIGVLVFRVLFKFVEPAYASYVKFSGLAIVTVGLTIVMLGVERKVTK
jgi:uncharacterized protein YjeT (DUF2065 family)